MALDLALFGSKLRSLREQFGLAADDIAAATGISALGLESYEAGAGEPTGDDILILADYFKCDYRFFISNERLTPFEQTEKLFRRWGQELSRGDRWAIQEFLFLCECEEDLMRALRRERVEPPTITKRGNFLKQQGVEAAQALRRHFGYAAHALPRDVYEDFRRAGAHVFRRKLENSSISGLYLKHPVAGPCILVNYSEDVFRQRFTAAHEMAHALLDAEEDFVVSFTWDQKALSEVRANAFASQYLVPTEFLRLIQDGGAWGERQALEWAEKLRVNPAVLANALERDRLVGVETAAAIRALRVPMAAKQDPELPVDLSAMARVRREAMLQRGLSTFYVELCFEAYREGRITAGRLSEVLLVPPAELDSLAHTFGRGLIYAD